MSKDITELKGRLVFCDDELVRQFRRDHTETIGEQETAFDQGNYIEWLEKQLKTRPTEPQQVNQGSEWVSAIDTVIEIVTILSFNENELPKFNYQGVRNILIELKENLPHQPPKNTEEEG